MQDRTIHSAGQLLRELALPLTALPFSVGGWRKPARHPISPLAGEMSGRTEGGGKDRHLSILTHSQPETA
ncbi:MAG: hypothetical protein EOR00_12605 [Mesorhizobium sp.]|nr:MAG: hypothetical protein EOR00_12605 [Mesorhizobium sp.]